MGTGPAIQASYGKHMHVSSSQHDCKGLTLPPQALRRQAEPGVVTRRGVMRRPASLIDLQAAVRACKHTF